MTETPLSHLLELGSDSVVVSVATNALALELVMQDRSVRRLALPAGVTRLLADALRTTV